MRDTRRARLAVGLLLAVALVLITVDHRAGSGAILRPVREAVSGMFGKAERVTAAVTKPVMDFVNMVRNAPGAKDAIAALRRENARLRAELSAQRLDRVRADKLDRMLGLAGLGRYRIVPAQVIARRSAAGFEEAVVIDAGTDDGVRPDMTVLTDAGLAGRVVEATADSATVVLLTDPAVSVGGRIEGGNQLGVVTGLGEAGGGDNLVKFRVLDSTTPLVVGARIVSFGSQQSRPYVAGVPIGEIKRVESVPGELAKIAYLRPYTDFSGIDLVGVVVKPPKRDPRDAVLPPLPRAAKEGAQRDRGDERASDEEEESAQSETENGRGERAPGTGRQAVPRPVTGDGAAGEHRRPHERT